MFERIKEDIVTILERDPAAHSPLEILLCYPGFHALRFYHCAHWCALQGWTTLSRLVSHMGRFFTGIEIHPEAKVGRRVFIDHGMGVVIGQTAEVGDDCTIYQGVTLGGVSVARGTKRHPTIGKEVIIGAGAQVLGGFTVGDGARIGANAVVLHEVAPGATVVGVPAHEAKNAKRTPQECEHFDPYGVTSEECDPVKTHITGLHRDIAVEEKRLRALEEAVARLEALVAGREVKAPAKEHAAAPKKTVRAVKRAPEKKPAAPVNTQAASPAVKVEETVKAAPAPQTAAPAESPVAQDQKPAAAAKLETQAKPAEQPQEKAAEEKPADDKAAEEKSAAPEQPTQK